MGEWLLVLTGSEEQVTAGTGSWVGWLCFDIVSGVFWEWGAGHARLLDESAGLF